MAFLIFATIFLLQFTAKYYTSATSGSIAENDFPYLSIEPLSSREYGQYVVKKVQDTLNLTCKVFDNSTGLDSKPRYNITWIRPSGVANSKNRVTIQSSSVNSVNLMVPHLESRDGGEYTCHAQSVSGSPHSLTSAVYVNIKQHSNKKKCGGTMFECNKSKLLNCIPRRFKCDGYQDCEEGEDEDPAICGDSPCTNKVPCGDRPVVRCIPKAWCCNSQLEPNCTIREPLSCCFIDKTAFQDGSYYPTHQQSYNDMTLLQTTIYTIIGCAMVFMIVVTVLVIAICRVHMKRSLMTQCPTSTSHSLRPPQLAPCNSQFHDLDVYLNRGCGLEPLRSPGFLVTYNVNNGVRFVGHPVDPPPYSEVVSAPPIEGPPPPYSSCEALDQAETEALLQLQPAQNTSTNGGLMCSEQREEYQTPSAPPHHSA